MAKATTDAGLMPRSDQFAQAGAELAKPKTSAIG